MLTYKNTALGFEFTIIAFNKKDLFAQIEKRLGTQLEPVHKAMISRQLKRSNSSTKNV